MWQKCVHVLACVAEMCVLACMAEMCACLVCVVEMYACFSVCGRNVCVFWPVRQKCVHV